MVLLILLICKVYVAGAVSNCFWLDGSQAIDLLPCHDLGRVGAAMCCGDKEDCVKEGLCTNSLNGLEGPYDNGKSIWRRACSDRSWQDPACMAFGPCEPPIYRGS